MNVLLGVTGSVASTLTLKLKVGLAISAGHHIKTVVTNAAENFKEQGDAWGAYLTDKDEWHEYRYKRKVLHIDLIKWADILVIAPCTANTLAKIANGIADNLLTNCALAWNYNKPILIAPAMNCVMLTHPATQKNIKKVIDFGAEIIEPQEKTLFCGDKGLGAMADIQTIIDEISKYKI